MSFVDPSGPVSRSEPIDYVATQTVTAISVKFGTGQIAEERVYRDGAFLYPYLSSTQVGLTFSIIRTGGWPDDFRVFVDELATSTSGLPWGVIHDINLTTVTASTIVLTSAGSYSVGGTTWWAKGAIGAGTCELRSTGFAMGGGTSFAGVGAETSRHIFIPLSSVPGYNALAPLQVWFHSERLSGGAVGMGAGFIDCTSDSAAIVTGQRASQFLVGPGTTSAVTPSTATFVIRGSTTGGSSAGISNVAPYTTFAYGVALLLDNYDAAVLSNAYAGGVLPPAAPFSYVPYFGGSVTPRSNPGILLCTFNSTNVNLMTRMTFLQPRNP